MNPILPGVRSCWDCHVNLGLPPKLAPCQNLHHQSIFRSGLACSQICPVVACDHRHGHHEVQTLVADTPSLDRLAQLCWPCHDTAMNWGTCLPCILQKPVLDTLMKMTCPARAPLAELLPFVEAPKAVDAPLDTMSPQQQFEDYASSIRQAECHELGLGQDIALGTRGLLCPPMPDHLESISRAELDDGPHERLKADSPQILAADAAVKTHAAGCLDVFRLQLVALMNDLRL